MTSKAVRLWQFVSDMQLQSSGPEFPSTTNSSSSDETLSSVNDPCDVAFLGPYSFIVADSTAHRLIIVDIARNVCSVIADKQVWPNGVDVTDNNQILVTDRRHKGVTVYDAERGDRISAWSPGDDILRCAHGIASNSRGQAIVTDTGRSAVCLFSVRDGGKLIRRFGSRGDQLQQLRLPFYCAYDEQRDEILVSDNMNYCVKIFDAGRGSTDRAGPFLRRIGSGNAFGQRQFQCPYGVTVDKSTSNILVADYDTHRIFEFEAEGRFVRYALTGADGCRGPCGLAVHPDSGILVVTETGDATGGTSTTPATASNTQQQQSCWPSNIKAYRLHNSDSCRQQTIVAEQIWTFKTESVV